MSLIQVRCNLKWFSENEIVEVSNGYKTGTMDLGLRIEDKQVLVRGFELGEFFDKNILPNTHDYFLHPELYVIYMNLYNNSYIKGYKAKFENIFRIDFEALVQGFQTGFWNNNLENLDKTDSCEPYIDRVQSLIDDGKWDFMNTELYLFTQRVNKTWNESTEDMQKEAYSMFIAGLRLGQYFKSNWEVNQQFRQLYNERCLFIQDTYDELKESNLDAFSFEYPTCEILSILYLMDIGKIAGVYNTAYDQGSKYLEDLGNMLGNI